MLSLKNQKNQAPNPIYVQTAIDLQMEEVEKSAEEEIAYFDEWVVIHIF